MRALPALVCPAALVPLFACSGSDGNTLLAENLRPTDFCKFVDTKTKKAIEFDKLVYNDATFWTAL